ncbi:MAG: DUF3566 domain-containing protein [Micrococcales bacterium]
MSIAEKIRSRRPKAGGKQVKLNLVQIDFWSAVKVGFVIQIALAIANIVGFFVLWLVLVNTGLFSGLNGLLNGVIGGSGEDIGSSLSLPRVMSFAVALSVFNIVAGTLLSGVVAAIFNAISRITGGVSVGFTNN